jgi:LCP family protein required for cell wall assembly
MGLDAGDYDNKSSNKPKRSDTMMLVRYIPETEKVYILSLPRDTRVLINGQVEKLNASHIIGGADLTIKTIEKMLGISINYYAEVDYAGFRECIDAIGGIDIVIPRDMDYDAYDIKIHFNKGETVHLDGKKAEEFVRWRKNNDGSGYAMGDLGRIGTQQEFLMKVAEKIKSPSSITKLPSLINTLSKYVKTNMSPSMMLKYGLRLKNIETAAIEKKVLEGEPQYIGKISYFIINKGKNTEYLSNFKDSVAIKNINRSEVSVVVLNSTGVKGLAKKYADDLSNIGYNVIGTENYSKKVENTIISDFSENGSGNFVCEDIKVGEVIEKVKDDRNSINKNADVVVILGMDSVK